MDKTVFDAMNEHINYEFYSGYIYLALAIQMEKKNYKGLARWLKKHYGEELRHAQDFIDFMIKRDQSPVLLDIKMENFDDVEEPLEVANKIYEHEKTVTQSIYKLHDMAKKADDYATEVFMHSYIEEQTEEEDITKDIVDMFTLAADDMGARVQMDRMLWKRANKDHSHKDN